MFPFLLSVFPKVIHCLAFYLLTFFPNLSLILPTSSNILFVHFSTSLIPGNPLPEDLFLLSSGLAAHFILGLASADAFLPGGGPCFLDPIHAFLFLGLFPCLA